MKKVCLDCGSGIQGRSDKKFCSDYCRNNYHNRKNQISNNYVRKINYVLRKNRRILEKFNQHGLEKVKKSTLLKEGFDFEYITRVVQNGNAPALYLCYDHGYQILENELIELIVRDDGT
jgi:hypothetical protein